VTRRSPRAPWITAALLASLGCAACQYIAGIEDVTRVDAGSDPCPDAGAVPVCDAASCAPDVVGEPADGGLLGVAAYDGALLWTAPAEGAVFLLPPGQQVPIKRIGGAHNPRQVAADVDGIYWTTYSDACLSHVPSAGGKNVFLGACKSGSFTAGDTKIALDASRAYWILSDGSTSEIVAAVKQADATAVELATGEAIAAGIAVDGTYAYWGTSSGGMGAIRRRRLDGVGQAEDFASFVGAPTDLATSTDDPHLYWVAKGGAAVYRKHRTQAGAAVELLAADAKLYYGAFDMAVDADGVYWADNASGKILHAPKTPGAPAETLHAGGAMDPWGIVVDCTGVWWTTLESGTLMRLPR